MPLMLLRSPLRPVVAFLGVSLTLALGACGSSDSETPSLKLIAVTPASPSLAQGAQQQLSATGKYTDGSTKDLTATVTWATLDAGVATVSAGLVSASSVTGGTAVITATLGEQAGFTEVTVTGSRLGLLRFVPASVKVAAGFGNPVRVLGVYDDGTERDLTAIAALGSDDPSIATAAAGVVSGVAAGDTTVSAAVGAVTGSMPVTVTSATLSSITVSPSNAPTLAPGRIEGFGAFGRFDDGTTVDLTEQVTWASSDTGVATVSNDPGTRGQVSALVAGTTNVTATHGLVASAPRAFTVADAATDYVETRIPLDWTPMAGAEAVVSGDDVAAALPLVDAFHFNFFGTSYTTDQLSVSTNGVLFFGPSSTSTSYGTVIPTATAPNGFVAAYWMDLETIVRMSVLGTAPSRQLVLEWAGAPYGGVVPIDFELVLTEGSDTIEVRYLFVEAPGVAVTVGVENQTGTVGTQHSGSTDAVLPGMALRFSP